MSTIKSLRFDISSGWDGAGVTKAREDIAALKKDLDTLSNKDVKIKVTIDSTAAKAELDSLKAKADALSGKSVKITVNADTAAARTNLDAIKSKADTLAGKNVKLNVNANTALAGAHLDQIRLKADSLNGKNVRIDVNVNSAAASAHLDELRLRTSSTRGELGRLAGDASSAAGDLARVGGAAATTAGSVAQTGGAAASAGASFGGMAGPVGIILAILTAMDLIAPILAASIAVIPLGFMAAAALLIGTNKKLKESFKDAFGDTTKALLKDAMPLVDAMLKGIKSLNAFLNATGPEIKAAFAAAAPLVQPFVNILTRFVQAVLPGLTDGMNHMQPLFAALAQGAALFGGALGKMVDILAKTPGLSTAVTQMFAGLALVLVQLAKNISAVIAANPALLGQFFTFIAQAMRLLLPLLIEWGYIMSGLMVILTPMIKGLANLGTAFRNLGQWAKDALQGLKVAWDATWAALQAANAAGGAALKSAWNATWNGIKTAATAVWNALKTAWHAVTGAFATSWTAIGNGLKAAWTATWNGMKTAATAVWNGLKTAWNAVAHAFSTAWTAVSGALKSAWSATWNGLKTTGTTIWNGMKTAWHTVAGAFATAWHAVEGGLKTAWSATWNFLKSTGTTIWNAIKTGWHNFVNDILKTIGEWAIKAVAAVAKFFTTLGKDFAKGLKDLGSTLLKGGIEVAKELINGLIHGLEAGVGGLLGKVASVGKKVVDGFKHIFHINSPSQDTHEMGVGLNEGLSNGLSAGLMLSLAAAAKVGIQTINALKNAFRTMSNVGMEAMQLLDSGFKAGMMILQVTVQQFGPKITASFKTTFAQLKTTVTQTMTEVNSAVKTGMTQMQASFTAGLTTIKAAWVAAWNNLKSTSTTAWNAIKAAWTVFVKTFQTAWNTASAALKAKWTADWTALKTTANTAWTAIKTAWTTFTATFATQWATSFAALNTAWTTNWTTMKTAAQTIWDAMKTAFTKFGADLNSAWATASTTLQNAMKTAWTNMNTAAQSGWQTITQTIGTAVNKIIGIVNSLIKAWNSVASAVDLPSISAVSPASFAQGGIVQGYAEGGVVGMHMGVNLANGGVLGGYEPGKDTVPAMLSKGEGVLVPEAVRGLGESFVHGANHHFSGGRAGSAGGFSGGRAHFAAGGVAGSSVATGAFGLPDPNAVKAMFDPLIAQLRGIGGWSHGAGEKFGGVGQKMEDKLIQAIQAKIAAMMAAMAAAAGAAGAKGAISGNVKGLAGMIAKALAAAGIPATAANIAAMQRRIMIESSGNPNAVNNWDINAKMGTPSMGLAQITTTNFAKYGSGNILNPQDNLNAAAKYIQAIYGGRIPQGAAYANGTNNAARGWALVGEEGPEMVNFGGGETVLNAGQTAGLAGGGGGGGGTVVNVSIDARGSTPESVDKLKSEAIPQLRMALQAGVGKKGR